MNGPAIELSKNGYMTRLGFGALKTVRIDCDDVYLSDPWADGWGLIKMLKDLYDRIGRLEG